MATLANKPSSMAEAFGMIVVPTPRESSYCRQIIFAETGATYERYCDDNNWFGWHKFSYDIPTFYKDYNSLASLASALGVCKYYDIGATECNCTTSPLIDVAFSTIIRSTNFVGAPDVTGILYTFRGASSLYFQVFILQDLNAIYIRPKGKTWVKIWE